MNRLRNCFRDISDIMREFKKFDTNCDGALSQQEVVAGMKNMGMNFESKECENVFAMADLNQDGEISFVEFACALFPAAADGVAKFRARLGAITDVKMAFKRFDADGDGEISINELKNGAGSGFSSGEIAAVFALGDSDGDGNISFAEFAQLVLPSARDKVSALKRTFKSSQDIQAAFQRFDVNMDGMISCDELKNGLHGSGMKMNDQEVMTVFAMADTDGDGEISLQEFSALLGSSSGSAPAAAPSSGSLQFRSVDEVKNAFKKFDINNDGHLDRNEFKQLVASCNGGSDQAADALFKQGDSDGDGKLDYQELIKLLYPASAQALQKLHKNFSNLNEVKAAFKRFDADGDGHISKQELQQVMKGFSAGEVESIFALGDKDQSGGIDIQEFISLMLPSAPATIARLSQNFRSVANVKDSFKKFDANGDGQISRNELKNAMKLNDADLDTVFALGDLDGDGEISMGEFVLIMSAVANNAVRRFRNCFASIHDIASGFKQFDNDNDGAITQQELAAGMRNMRMSFSNEETNAIFSAADTNTDGDITYLEFVTLLIPTAGDALFKFRKCFNDLKSVRAAFKQFDADNDGSITRNEVIQGMQAAGKKFNQEEIDTFFVLADRDGDGSIDFPEFALIMIPSAPERITKLKHILNSKQKVETAFKTFDSNNDGAIDAGEMKAGLKSSGVSMTDQEVETIFAVADLDGDGQVSLGEFTALLCGGSSGPSAAKSAAAPKSGGGNASAVVAKFRQSHRTIDQVRAAFTKYDTNRDGNISRQELASGMAGQFSAQESSLVFDLADSNGDGEIDMGEFVTMMFPAAGQLISNLKQNFRDENDVKAAFKSWDSDGDGEISFKELQSAVQRSGQRLSEEDINAIFVVGDADQNGSIDLQEFMAMMMPQSSDVVAKFRAIRKTVKDVQNAFKQFDRDGDGSIDKNELSQGLSQAGNFTKQDIDTLFAAGDVDGDGAIDYEEFIALMCPSVSDIIEKFRAKYRNVNDVKAAFKRFDRNGDGALEKNELCDALKSSGESYSDVEVDAIFSLGDVDGDGEITLEEFIGLMSPSASSVVQRISKTFRNINDCKDAFKKIDRV